MAFHLIDIDTLPEQADLIFVKLMDKLQGNLNAIYMFQTTRMYLKSNPHFKMMASL